MTVRKIFWENPYLTEIDANDIVDKIYHDVIEEV
jgi:hypothetical protein